MTTYCNSPWFTSEFPQHSAWLTFKLGKTEMSTKILTVCFKKQSSVSKIQCLGNFEVPSGPNQKYSPLFTSLSFLSKIIFWWQTELSVAVIYHRLGLHYNFLWNGITPCEDLFCSVEWKSIKHSFLHNLSSNISPWQTSVHL